MPAKSLTQRNPRTTARFRRQSWWQIVFPVLLVALLSLAILAFLAIMAFGGQPSHTSLLADYALILLIIPTLLGALIVLLLILGLWYLFTLLIRHIPPYAYVAQQSMDKVHHRVTAISSSITGFIISVRGFIAGIRAYLKTQGIFPDGKTAQPTDPA